KRNARASIRPGQNRPSCKGGIPASIRPLPVTLIRCAQSLSERLTVEPSMNSADLARVLQDVSAVTITAFKPDLSIDEEATRRHLRFLVQGGVRVLVPGGNTGEFYALSREENERLIRLACAEAAGKALIVAGAGYSVPDTIALAKVAEQAG